MPGNPMVRTPVSLLTREKLAGYSGLCILVAIIFLFTTCQISTVRHQTVQKRAISILTYNIRTGLGMDGVRDLDRIAQVIQQFHPDIVALQEVDVATRRSGGLNEAQALARRTGLQAYFFPAMPFDGGWYGIAILTNLRVIRKDTLPLPGEPRVAGVLYILPPRTTGLDTLLFIATHLDTKAIFRRKSLPILHHFIERNSHLTAILAGDLNAPPDSPTLTALNDDWFLPPEEKGLRTYPADNPQVQIDYILVRPAGAWTVLQAEVGTAPVASDHRPVFMRIRWDRKTTGEKERHSGYSGNRSSRSR